VVSTVRYNAAISVHGGRERALRSDGRHPNAKID
jgi:hypothetical protein